MPHNHVDRSDLEKPTTPSKAVRDAWNLLIAVIVGNALKAGVGVSQIERAFGVGNGSGNVLATWRNAISAPSGPTRNHVVEVAHRNGWLNISALSKDQLDSISVLPDLSIHIALPLRKLPKLPVELLQSHICHGNPNIAASQFFSAVHGTKSEKSAPKMRLAALLGALERSGYSTECCTAAVHALRKEFAASQRDEEERHQNGEAVRSDAELERYWITILTVAFIHLSQTLGTPRGQQISDLQ